MFQTKILRAFILSVGVALVIDGAHAEFASKVSRIAERTSNDYPWKTADDNGVIVDPNYPLPSPTIDPCSDNGNGTFGNTNGDAYELTYFYEMVTTPGSDASSVLASLESSIANTVLSSTLMGCVRRKLIRKRRTEGTSLVGISSSPADSVTGEECAIAEGEPCDIVSGKMTLYLSENDETVQADILEIIKTGMTSGSFASEVEGIEELVYFVPDDGITDDDDDAAGAVQSPGESTNDQAAKGGLSTIPLIASGVAALVLLGVVAGRRAYKKRSEFNELDDDGEDHEQNKNDTLDNSAVLNTGSMDGLNDTQGSVTVTSCCDAFSTPY